MKTDTPTDEGARGKGKEKREEVKERPILFSGAMVRAILEGRKTQTRRVVKHQECHVEGAVYPAIDFDGQVMTYAYVNPHSGENAKRYAISCPYGNPGERLWVRETWSHTGSGVWTIAAARSGALDGKVIYKATDEEPCPGCWWPSIHMPREFSRLTLEVVGVRVERLQEISEADAKAEGCESTRWFQPRGGPESEGRNLAAVGDVWNATWDDISYRNGYANVWEDINGPGSWELNPWVWVVEFRRVEGA
jgi:hypothetical protein